MRRALATLTTLLLILSAACGGADEGGMNDMDAGAAASTDSGMAAMSGPGVTIVQPATGDTVAGPSVTVRLEVSGLTIAMAGDTTPNTGHHHLFLDRDLTPPDVPVPSEPGFIVHMGDASTSYTFENVPPGEHRLIAVVGDAMHVPLQPWVVDTVRFVVR